MGAERAGLKKLKNEAALVTEALRVGAIYASKRGVEGSEATPPVPHDDDPDREPATVAPAVGTNAASGPPAPSGEAGPLMATQTWNFVAGAKRAEDGRPSVDRLPAAAPRIVVPDRTGSGGPADDADELAVVRRRRERAAARGLSDEVWESVRRSVFDKLDD